MRCVRPFKSCSLFYLFSFRSFKLNYTTSFLIRVLAGRSKYTMAMQSAVRFRCSLRPSPTSRPNSTRPSSSITQSFSLSFFSHGSRLWVRSHPSNILSFLPFPCGITIIYLLYDLFFIIRGVIVEELESEHLGWLMN